MPRQRTPEDVLPLEPKPFLLLLTLQEGGLMHGYAIKKAMRERSEGAVSIDPGGLYRLIARLQREGLVRHAARPVGDEDERRQYVAITEWGRAVLIAEARRIAALARLPSVRQLAGGGR